jgi:hypothetical protein
MNRDEHGGDDGPMRSDGRGPKALADACVSTVTLTGVAFAQQPTPQPNTPAQDLQARGTGVGMTNPMSPDGKPITTNNLPTIQRGTGVGMTNPMSPDGKPITTSTNLGQR